MSASKYQSANIELAQLRSFYDKSDNIAYKWGKEWQWLVDEYAKLSEKLTVMSNKMDVNDPSKNKKITDSRTIRAIPESVNHEYGWLIVKEEFRLEKYGPDVYFPSMLPEYKIMK